MDVRTSVQTKVTAYLCARDAAAAIDWYRRAFGAEELWRDTGEDGRIGHAEITIGETTLMISDEWPQHNIRSPRALGGNSVSFVIDVPDVDAAFQHALDSGAALERAITDMPYGRGGWLIDPFGHRWHLLTPNSDFKPGDM